MSVAEQVMEQAFDIQRVQQAQEVQKAHVVREVHVVWEAQAMIVEKNGRIVDKQTRSEYSQHSNKLLNHRVSILHRDGVCDLTFLKNPTIECHAASPVMLSH